MADPAALDAARRRLPRILAVWAAASLFSGVALQVAGHRRGDDALRAAGRQCLGWGAVDGVIAVQGIRTMNRPPGRPPADEQRRLRRLLVANSLADVGYLAGGLAWARRGTPGARGAGLAVVVQGGFLLALDVVHARRLRE